MIFTGHKSAVKTFPSGTQIVGVYHAMEHAGLMLAALLGKTNVDYAPRLHPLARPLRPTHAEPCATPAQPDGLSAVILLACKNPRFTFCAPCHLPAERNALKAALRPASRSIIVPHSRSPADGCSLHPVPFWQMA